MSKLREAAVANSLFSAVSAANLGNCSAIYRVSWSGRIAGAAYIGSFLAFIGLVVTIAFQLNPSVLFLTAPDWSGDLGMYFSSLFKVWWILVLTFGEGNAYLECLFSPFIRIEERELGIAVSAGWNQETRCYFWDEIDEVEEYVANGTKWNKITFCDGFELTVSKATMPESWKLNSLISEYRVA